MLDIIEQISELMDEHGDYLKRTASIITGDPAIAEDMVQETFISFYKNRKQFRKDAKTRTYLYRILMNNIKMYYRKNKVRECVFETAKAGIVSFENKSIQEIDLHDAVSKLKPAYRQIIVLHYFSEMSIEEISKVMDMGKSAVKMRLKRARDELTRNLSKRRDTL